MDDKRLQVDLENTTVNGEQGQRLASLQADVILDVLRWLSDHHRDVQPGHTRPPTGESSR